MEEEQPQAALLELPDFEPESTDREATIVALQNDISETAAAAVARIALRRRLDDEVEVAKLGVQEAYEEEIGKDQKEMDEREKRRLSRRKSKAAKAVRKRFEAEHGDLKAQRHLFYGVTGGGKTRTIARFLASLKSGQYVVVVPTVVKAFELAAEIEKYRPRLPVFPWRGRTHEFKDRMRRRVSARTIRS